MMMRQLKQILTLLMTIVLTGTLSAQTSVSAKADNDLKEFESQYHAGANSTQLYETLYSAYKGYLYVIETNPNDRTALAGLRKIYPYMINGTVFYSSNNNNTRAYDFATAYIDMPTLPAFKKERFSRDNQYPQFCYFAATIAYNNKQYDDAIKYYKFYIESGDKIYLEKSMTSLKNTYYLKITDNFKNKDFSPQTEQIINELLELDPNNIGGLFNKAILLNKKGDLKNAVQVYERLYRMKPNELSICRNYALTSFKYANELINENDQYQAKKHLETSAYIFGLLADNTSDENTPVYRQGHNQAKEMLSKLSDVKGKYYASTGQTPHTNSTPSASSNYTSTRTQTPVSKHEYIAFSELPSFIEYAKKFVEDGVNSWQKKDDYETMNEYKARVTEQSREVKKKQLAKAAENNYIAEYGSRISLDNLRLEKYDADNGVFLITSPDFGNMLLPVPRANNEARSFEQQWGTVKIENPQYCIANDKLALSQLSFRTNTGKRYTYNNEAQLTYNNTTIEYRFEEVDVNGLIANDNQPTSGATIVNNNVSVGKSDVDIDIPETNKTNENLFAVIFANENYRRESKVSFAHNDGTAFKNYCIKTLGCPENNVHFVKDATLNDFIAETDWVTKIAEAYDGEAQILLYYAGHGVPDEASKSAYLLPTDGMASNIRSGYKLDDLYATLGNLPAKSVTVFLDACFSGAQRSGGPMESKKDSRAPIIKAKASIPQGKMVVLSAATGDETAFPYKEHQHGMFTYFLLKKLKESNGEATYGELADYITKNVTRNSLRINNKSQTPTATASPAVTEDEWKKWKLRN